MSPDPSDAVARLHYFDREFGRTAVKLLPSEYYVARGGKPLVLLTVLGSCVAACLHDPLAGVAGMNHFMLPDESGRGMTHPDAMRYGAHAMDVLIRELVRAGARRERLQAKVFGGAAVLSNMPSFNVGGRNAEFILRYLDAQRINLYAQDLGGPHARRVALMTETGRVVVRELRAAADLGGVERAEREFLVRLTGEAIGEVSG